MALSYAKYTGTGTTTQFPITFPYIDASHIFVSVNGTDVAFTSDVINQVVTLSSAPVLGSDIRVYRFTPRNKTYSDFSRGNALGQRNMNNSFLWQLYISQEIAEGGISPEFVMSQDLNMGGHKVTNMKAGTDDDDAITYKQLNDALVNVSAQGVVPIVGSRQVGVAGQSQYDTPATKEATPASFRVSIDGLLQRPVTDYTTDTIGKIDFLGTVPVGADIDVVYFEPNINADNTYEYTAGGSFTFSKLKALVNSSSALIINLTADVSLVADSTIDLKGKSLTINANHNIINWSGAYPVFLLENSIYKENGVIHKNSSSSSIMTLLTANSDVYIGSIYSNGCEYDGHFKNRFTSNHNLNPESSDFGFDVVSYHSLKLKNSKVYSFFLIDSLPFNLVEVKNPIYENVCRVPFSMPVQNFHPYYSEVQRSMKLVDYTGLSWINDNDYWADDDLESSGYYVMPLLWEGNRLIWNNNYIKEVKSKKSGTTIVPVYLAGLHAEGSKNFTRNMYGFNTTKVNTGLHLKKVINANFSHVYHEFDHDFFGRILNDFGYSTTGTLGDWITYAPEATNGGETICINNYYCELPKLNSTGTLTAPLLQRFSITDSEFISYDTGHFNLIRCNWTLQNRLDNRYAEFLRNKVIAPNCAMSRIMYVGISDERSNNNGCRISNHSNEILCGSVRELHLDAGAATTPSNCKIDNLTLNNKVRVNAAHDAYTLGNKQPKIIDLYTGGTYTAEDRIASVRTIGQNCFNDDVANGKYQISYGNSTDVNISLITTGFPSDNYVNEKTFVYSGSVVDKDGFEPFTLRFTLQNIQSGSIDIAYTQVNGQQGLATWNGAGNTIIAKVETNHATLGARIVRSSSALTVILALDPNQSEVSFAQFNFDVAQF